LMTLNKISSRRQCNICQKTFYGFIPYQWGKRSNFITELNMIDSNNWNFGCPFCGANDRTRHIFLYFDKLNIWKVFDQKRVLHIAPEFQLYLKLKDLNLKEYIVGDINPQRYNKIQDVQKTDLTKLNFPDNYFDVIIANHVLEHIPNFTQAINEIYRTLKPDGFAVIQVPYSSLLYNSIEDPNINTDELRLRYYGEKDHFRLFGLDFFDILQKKGFKLETYNHSNYISPDETIKFGLNPKENLHLFKK